MTNKTDPEIPRVKTIFLDHMGTMALAFGVSFILLKLISAFGLSAHAALAFNMVVFFTILHVDPVAALREGKPKRDMVAKLIVGLVIAVILAIPFALDLFSLTPADATVEPGTEQATRDGKSIFTTIWPVMFGLFALPLFFIAPLAEKALKQDGDSDAVTKEDLKISVVFPIYLMISMTLNLAIPGAMWLLGMSLWMAGLVMTAAILICVAETWMADPEDLVEDVDNMKWGPRAESSQEAWKGLRKAIKQCFSSALFIGSILYISLQLAIPYMGEAKLSDGNGLQLILGMLSMSGVMLVSFLLLFVVGMVILVAASYVLGRTKEVDPLTMAELVSQAQMRLLAGGMQWVRPDLEDD